MDGSEQNGKKPERRLSSISDDIVLNFPPSVSGYSRVASTGVDVRDRCRDLVVKAMMKGFDNGQSGLACHYTFLILFIIAFCSFN